MIREETLTFSSRFSSRRDGVQPCGGEMAGTPHDHRPEEEKGRQQERSRSRGLYYRTRLKVLNQSP